jgi:hypothetical protein
MSKPSLYQRWKKTTIANQALVVTGILVAFSTLFYMVATVIQVVLFYQNIHETSKQTDKLVAASERLANTSVAQVNAMQGQLNAMQEQANALKASLEETRKAANAATTQAAASQTQAKASVAQAEAARQSVGAAQITAKAAEQSSNTATQALAAGERAYVGAEDIKIVNPPLGQHPRILATFINGGRTPASHFVVYARLSWGERYIPPVWNPTNYAANAGAYLPAGARKIVILEDFIVPLTEQELSEIRAGTRKLFLGVVAHYIDFLGHEQTLTYCALYYPTESNFIECYQDPEK